MAYTYSSTPVLSKIKIGNDYYYLKDADVRSILDGFNNAIVTGQLGTVSQQNKLVYSQDIKSYVDSAVAVGLVIEVVTELPEATADEMGKIYLVAQSGGKTGDAYDEYIVVRSGTEGSYTYAWEKIGDTRIDLSGFVSDVKYTASSHKLQQQKGGSGSYSDIHTFGAMADADQGEATVSDYVTGVSSAKVTASGSISTLSVIDSVGTLPTKAADTFSANKPTVIDTSKFNGGSAASLGTGFFTAGTAATFTEGAFSANVPTAIDTSKFSGGSKAADTFNAAAITASTKVTFAKEGITATVGSGADAETLIIGTASTASALTGVTLSGGSFTEGQFTPASLASGFYTPGTAASKAADTFSANTPASVDVSKFNGGQAASLASGFYTAGTAATFSEGAFTQGSLPTKKAVTPTFTGSEVNATVSLSKGNKTITVNPKASE